MVHAIDAACIGNTARVYVAGRSHTCMILLCVYRLLIYSVFTVYNNVMVIPMIDIVGGVCNHHTCIRMSIDAIIRCK